MIDISDSCVVDNENGCKLYGSMVLQEVYLVEGVVFDIVTILVENYTRSGLLSNRFHRMVLDCSKQLSINVINYVTLIRSTKLEVAAMDRVLSFKSQSESSVILIGGEKRKYSC